MNVLIEDKNAEAVQRLRERFAKECEPELYHPIDVERVGSESWQIERFILAANGAEDDAYNELTRVLRWKKSIGLHDRTDEYFPREFYQIFTHEKYSRDRKGRLVVWFCENRYRKVAEISPIIQQFLTHQLERQDRTTGPVGWITISDCSASGLANVDLQVSRYRVEQLNNYPKGVRMSLNVDMPWIVNSVFKVVKNIMSKETRDQMNLVKKSQLVDYVDIESIPTCFNGKRECIIDDLNNRFKPLYECKHLGLNETQIDAFYNTYKDLFRKQ